MTGDVKQLMAEHLVSWRQYGAAQQRCSQVISAQHARIVELEAQLLRARAAGLVQTTALAIAEQERARLMAVVPDLPTRLALRQRVEMLVERVQSLMRERLQWQWWQSASGRRAHASAPRVEPLASGVDAQALEDSLVAADLVICQTGCLSHGDYWRVQDHCRRTGKACVLVEQPDAVRIVRLHRVADAAALTD